MSERGLRRKCSRFGGTPELCTYTHVKIQCQHLYGDAKPFQTPVLDSLSAQLMPADKTWQVVCRHLGR